MNIASIQLSVIEDSKARALDHVQDVILRCRGADLIMLPELWNIGFMSYDRYRQEAEAADGPTVTLLSGLARDLRCYIHTGSIVLREHGRYYNASFLLDREGTVVGSYRKVHLFTFRSAESEILTPGRALTVLTTDFGPVGLATCYDLRFPEFFRKMVDMGAEIFLVAAAWPYPRLEHWLLFNRVRALENLAFLVSSNSCGINRGTQFVGHSQVVDPMGNVIAGSGDDETVVWSPIDAGAVRTVRESFPALKDRVLTTS